MRESILFGPPISRLSLDTITIWKSASGQDDSPNRSLALNSEEKAKSCGVATCVLRHSSSESIRLDKTFADHSRKGGSPSQSSPFQSNSIQSRLIQSNPIQSHPIQPNPIQSNPIPSSPIQSPIQSSPIQSNPIQSNPIQSESNHTHCNQVNELCPLTMRCFTQSGVQCATSTLVSLISRHDTGNAIANNRCPKR